MSNQSIPPIVRIVPDTEKKLSASFIATTVTAIGLIIQALQSALPQLEILFPRQKWIGPTVAAVGIIFLSIQRGADRGTSVPTNTVPEPSNTTID